MPEHQVRRVPDFGYYALQYNLREGQTLADGSEWQGRLFDIDLRQAVQNCIDKAGTGRAGDEGQGVPIESDIPPASWAYNPDLRASSAT